MVKYELRGNNVIKITTTEEVLDLNDISRKELLEVIKELVNIHNNITLTPIKGFTSYTQWDEILC